MPIVSISINPTGHPSLNHEGHAPPQRRRHSQKILGGSRYLTQKPLGPQTKTLSIRKQEPKQVVIGILVGEVNLCIFSIYN